MHAGYGSYGPPPGWGHGARVLLLKAGQAAHEAETWIRLENGARVDQSKNPKFASALQTICEPGASPSIFLQASRLGLNMFHGHAKGGPDDPSTCD